MPPRKEHTCAKYSLPPFDWLKLSHHLVSGESTLHEVTLFEARSRIFLPTAESRRLYSAAASPFERLRSDGSLAINRGRLNPTPKIINVIDIIEHLNFGIFFLQLSSQ